jgi:hypothetical protein
MAKDEAAVESAMVKRDEVTSPLREAAFAKSTVSPETFQSAVTLNVNKTIDDILASDKMIGVPLNAVILEIGMGKCFEPEWKKKYKIK